LYIQVVIFSSILDGFYPLDMSLVLFVLSGFGVFNAPIYVHIFAVLLEKLLAS